MNRRRAAFRETNSDGFRKVGGCFVLRQPRARVPERRGRHRAARSALFSRKIPGYTRREINFQLRRRSAVVKSRCRRFVLCVLQSEWAIKINWLKIVFHNSEVKKKLAVYHRSHTLPGRISFRRQMGGRGPAESSLLGTSSYFIHKPFSWTRTVYAL